MTKEQTDQEVARFVSNYKEMRATNPSLYNEAMWQYADMANGGRGHDGHETYIRDQYYKGYSNDFFVLVLSGLGEFEKYVQRPW